MLELPALAHPLTGPVEVIGAQPGDVLELEVLGYETDDFGWTAIFPGAGFLADVFSEPFVVKWELGGRGGPLGAAAGRGGAGLHARGRDRRRAVP